MFAPVLLAAALGAASPQTIFEFHNSMWMSLHHVLYELGRAKHAKQTPAISVDTAGLTAAERKAWDAAVDRYAKDLGARDLLFDDVMLDLKGKLTTLADDGDVEKAGLGKEIGRALKSTAATYRKRWWPEHQRVNQQFIDAQLPLIDRFGEAILEQLTATYRAPWQDRPVRVDVTIIANWAGAYTSTHGGWHTVISSRDPRHAGPLALEILFHEASHGLIFPMQERIKAQGEALKVPVDRDLWHALLFFTTGEIVKRTLNRAGIKYDKTYAEEVDLYGKYWSKLHAALEREWRPYLRGRVDMDSALAGVVRAQAPTP